MLCNTWNYTTWHLLKQILSLYLRNSTRYSLYAYRKFICWRYKRKITTEMPHMCNGRHIPRIFRQLVKLHVLYWLEDWNRCKVVTGLCNLWFGNVMLKNSSRNSLMEKSDFGLQLFCDVKMVLRLSTIRKSCNHLECTVVARP